MPYEVNIVVQLSAIPTEERAVELSNQLGELIQETICDSDIPDGDLVVSNHGIVEYDEDPATGVTVVPAEMYDELTTDAPDESNENLRRAEQRRRSLLEGTPEVES